MINIRLQRLRRSDAGPWLHDHSRPFIAVVLCGFWEHVFREDVVSDGRGYISFQNPRLGSVRLWRRAGSVLWRPRGFAHRVEVEPGTTALVLVVAFGRGRACGVYGPSGWIPWDMLNKIEVTK